MVNEIIKIPDIGSAGKVEVIEVLIKIGDTIQQNDALLTLESDKASMEIPSPVSGKILAIKVKIGDKVAFNDEVAVIEVEDNLSTQNIPTIATTIEPEQIQEISTKAINNNIINTDTNISAASPSVRRMAREFGIDLASINGGGRKHRITKYDLQQYVKDCLSTKNDMNYNNFAGQQLNIDFSVFGNIDTKPLSKIKQLTGVNVHRSWVTIPQVTQFDEVDITELEAFRLQENINKDYKLTTLAFIIKIVTKVLLIYPQFNASLDFTGQNIIYKYYYNIGIAVDTPNGLVVPVLKNVDQLSIIEIAKLLNILSQKARNKTLLPIDMSGGNFTISSLGGIGGTGFTPIVNSPEVAILGIARASIKPSYINNAFQPKLTLPLSLSYDHRVIDGAEAVRFIKIIKELLGDLRRVLL